jgi:hypothetical protein
MSRFSTGGVWGGLRGVFLMAVARQSKVLVSMLLIDLWIAISVTLRILI